MFAAALALVLGLALVGTVSPTVGGVVTLGSWLYFVYALHRYGRTGSSRTNGAPADARPKA